jgi:serine/threonine protein kinase
LDLNLLRSFSKFQPLSELRPDVSPALSNLVVRCLDPDPNRRPSAQQLEIELGRLSPTGSRFFDTVKRWSPTFGEILGTALATFVKMLFGRPASEGETPSGTPARSGTGASVARKGDSQRPAIPCLYCHGQGTTRGGRRCPICRGTGYW